MVVTLPPAHAKRGSKKAWPKVESPAGVPVKATQRDLRRYRKLRKGLEQYDGVAGWPGISVGNEGEYKATANEEEAVCEKASWAELAYSGFLWWASAGEKRQDNNAEESGDRVGPAMGRLPQRDEQEDQVPLLDGPADDERDDDYRQRRSSGVDDSLVETPGLPGPMQPSSSGAVELDIIAYFHRLTAKIVKGMAEVLESSDSGNDYLENGSTDEDAGEDSDIGSNTSERRDLLDGSGYRPEPTDKDNVDVWFSRDEMASMGLDRWSASDEMFLEEMGRNWWKRKVHVERVGVCGCLC